MKEKKTKRKLTSVSKKRGHSAPQDFHDPEKPQTVALPPDTSPALPQPPPHHSLPSTQLPKVKACGRADGQRARADGQRASAGGRKSKKQQLKHSTASSAGTGSKADQKKSTSGSSPQGGKPELLSPQSRETIRWEGVLEDPLAEEKRLELYRANRRQRYLAHRQAMMAGAHETATRQDAPKKDKDDSAVPDLNH